MKMPPCEKCGSKNTYLDSDGIGPVVACLMCGTRSGIRIILPQNGIDKEDLMAAKSRPCGNCGRTMTIVGMGYCGACYSAARGKDGEARESALAEVRQRITSGELQPRASRKKAQTQTVEPLVGELLVAEAGHEIPVTLKLTIEIGIRITGVTQAEA